MIFSCQRSVKRSFRLLGKKPFTIYPLTTAVFKALFKNFQNYIEEENEKGERILNKLLKENKIVKISGGRYTKYKWNN